MDEEPRQTSSFRITVLAHVLPAPGIAGQTPAHGQLVCQSMSRCVAPVFQTASTGWAARLGHDAQLQSAKVDLRRFSLYSIA